MSTSTGCCPLRLLPLQAITSLGLALYSILSFCTKKHCATPTRHLALFSDFVSNSHTELRLIFILMVLLNYPLYLAEGVCQSTLMHLPDFTAPASYSDYRSLAELCLALELHFRLIATRLKQNRTVQLTCLFALFV